MTGTSHAAVEFRNVTKRYGTFIAVGAISFAIEKGTMVTLLGPSGCGKTTTLRLIAGLEMATGGTIHINGIDVTNRPPTERDISMVFQSYALFPHMSVLRNVAYGLISSKRPTAEALDAARQALRLVGLEGLEDRLPSELSGGQQQRVAVARAVVLEPAVLLLDEPLSNLDAKLRRRVRDEIRELQQRLALTAVYVTHDQSEALAVSDTIIVMDQARIAQVGSPAALYRAPSSSFIARFIGEANVLPTRLARRDDRIGVAMLGDLAIAVPHRGLPDGPAQLVIRPEAVFVHTGAAGRDDVAGTIAHALYLGDHMEYTVDTAAGPLFVIDHDSDRHLAAGTKVSLSFRPSGLCLLPA